jgi:hypothetical protein
MKNTSALWVYLAAAIAVFGVTIHLAAIVGGPPWYEFFHAPPGVVASARAGTWQAPAGAAGIAVLMWVCALYACSAVGLIGRLPLLRPMLAGIASICLLRALALVPLSFIHPQLLDVFEVVAAIVWGTAGIGFAVGFLAARRPRRLFSTRA